MLQGLPDAGRCPECGEPYGPGIFIIWGRYGKNSGASSKGRAMVSIGIAFLFVASHTVFYIISPPRDLISLSLPLLIVLAMLIASWNILQDFQARITAGYGTRRGFGKVKMRSWKGDEEIHLLRLARDRWELTVRDNFAVPLHLNLLCTDDQAEEIRQEISRLTGSHVGLEK